jgi:hypothetical protein
MPERPAATRADAIRVEVPDPLGKRLQPPALAG